MVIVAAGLILYSQTYAFAWDEGFHLLAAQLIDAGKRPWLDFCFPQTPLNAYWNAGWMRVFGESWRVPACRCGPVDRRRRPADRRLYFHSLPVSSLAVGVRNRRGAAGWLEHSGGLFRHHRAGIWDVLVSERRRVSPVNCSGGARQGLASSPRPDFSPAQLPQLLS